MQFLSSRIKEVIFFYNLQTTLSLSQKLKWNLILNQLLNTIMSRSLSEKYLESEIANTVTLLENALNAHQLDADGHLIASGYLEYGGLNQFFAEIREALNFSVLKGPTYYKYDYVYNKLL